MYSQESKALAACGGQTVAGVSLQRTACRAYKTIVRQEEETIGKIGGDYGVFFAVAEGSI